MTAIGFLVFVGLGVLLGAAMAWPAHRLFQRWRLRRSHERCLRPYVPPDQRTPKGMP